MIRVFKLFCIIACVFMVAACGNEKSDWASAETLFPISIGDKTALVRIAITDIERTKGLMGCKKLNPDEGMLFIYATEDERSFWMANVPIDLSIGYFDSAGRLLEVHAMRAQDLSSIRSESDNVQYCLEMRSGWFSENAVVPGNVLDLSAVRKAVKARGFHSEI